MKKLLNESTDFSSNLMLHNTFEQSTMGKCTSGGQQTILIGNYHSGILGFMTLIPTENENILVFRKSKWIRKQKLNSNLGFFLEFFSQLILATGSQNRSPDIIVTCLN